MRRASTTLAALLGLAILTALACGPSIELPKLSLPAGARETAASAAEQAGRAAQTVAAVARGKPEQRYPPSALFKRLI